MLQASGFHSPLYLMKGEQIINDDFAPRFALSLAEKDLRLAQESAADQGASMPVSGAVRRLFASAARAGRGDKDMAAVADLLLEWTRTGEAARGAAKGKTKSAARKARPAAKPKAKRAAKKPATKKKAVKRRAAGARGAVLPCGGEVTNPARRLRARTLRVSERRRSPARRRPCARAPRA